MVADHHATHQRAKVKAWLAVRPRYHPRCTPSCSSWLNQVERWFGLISEQEIKRGSCHSEGSLIHRIHAFQREHNQHATPFAWVATARSILNKIERLCTHICNSEHSNAWHCGKGPGEFSCLSGICKTTAINDARKRDPLPTPARPLFRRGGREGQGDAVRGETESACQGAS